MTLVAGGIDFRLTLLHQSRLGATSFIMTLPETESALLILTNTMAFNDAVGWIGQRSVTTLLDSPVRHNYVHLASVSTDHALQRYAELGQRVENGRGLRDLF